MKIYLSGPMTGYADYNFPAFHKYAKMLRAMGHEVINPAETTPDVTLSYETFMRADLPNVCKCEAMALMPGWEKSRGVKNEIFVGQACGLKFYAIENDKLVDVDLSAGKKFDKGKLEWAKMRWAELTEIMQVLQFGADKYGWNNFENVEGAEDRYKSALMRHIIAYIQGEANDTESGMHHLAHAGCNVLFLLAFKNRSKI